jgi:pimeloyl-ACP methyl ester carboxylesterase
MPTEVTSETKAKERRGARQRERERVPSDDGEASISSASAAIAPTAPSIDARRAVRAGSSSATAEHVIFLVPGLLGFESFSSFTYFADRVIASLRAGAEQSLSQRVAVVPVPIPPTASLAERQCKLVKTMADRLHDLEHGYSPLLVHIVGHSTGGLDANLLTADKPIEKRTWSDVDPRAPALVDRIRSIVSISSPHQGAAITRDPLARLLSHRDPRGIPALASIATKLSCSLVRDMVAADFLSGATRAAPRTYRFLAELLSRWALLGDLDPSRPTSATLNLRPSVIRRSFVTLAGTPRPGASTSPPSDALFRELSDRATGFRTGCAEEGERVMQSVALLQRAVRDQSVPIIKADGIDLPTQIDAGHNDGVVNTARQLMDPSDPHELAGIVVADHFDVVGYYDRHVWDVDDEGHERSRQVVSGLLHSGCGFRDDQFFELYRRVGEVVAHSAAAASRAAPKPAFAHT